MCKNCSYTFCPLLIMTTYLISFSADAISLSALAPSEYHYIRTVAFFDKEETVICENNPGVRIKFNDGPLFDCDGEQHTFTNTKRFNKLTVYNYTPEKKTDVIIRGREFKINKLQIEPAAFASVNVNNIIDVALNESKGEMVTTKSLTYNAAGGGTLSFTPVNTPGQFSLQSGSDEMEYTINSDDDSSVIVSNGANIKNGSYHITFNPQGVRLHPGKYTGSLTVKLNVK